MKHISGVSVLPLKKIVDQRGMVLHMLRSDAEYFERFGEIYFSYVNPGVVKGWKRHMIMSQNFAVPVGEIKLVLFDDRKNSETRGVFQEVILGLDNYQLLHVPSDIWYSFGCLSAHAAMIANCASHGHDPAESEQRDLFSPLIPYTWNITSLCPQKL